MAELQLGDEVLADSKAGALTYSPVFMFTSHRPEETSTFVHITTSAGANITLTPSHYLFARKTSDVGDCAGSTCATSTPGPTFSLATLRSETPCQSVLATGWWFPRSPA